MSLLVRVLTFFFLGFCIVAVVKAVQHERACGEKAAEVLRAEVTSPKVVISRCDYIQVGDTTQYVCEVALDGEHRLIGVANFTCR